MCENLGGFSFRMLIFGRLIAGVGVGITSAAGPAFISDTGRLVEGMEMEMG
jgi:MFS family permease